MFDMDQKQKVENFSIIKQKIIKTDELINLFIKRNNNLKKLRSFCNFLQEKHEESLRTLKRFELENERLIFTVEKLRNKQEVLEEENKNLLTNKVTLEHDFNKQVVDNMQTIKDLQDEMKLLQDIKSAAQTINNNERKSKIEVSSSEKTKKHKNKETQESYNKAQVNMKLKYEEIIGELQNENKYLSDKIEELGHTQKEHINKIAELQQKIKATSVEENLSTPLISQEELLCLQQEITSLKKAKAKLEIIQIENEMLKGQINNKDQELEEIKQFQKNKTSKTDIEVQTDFARFSIDESSHSECDFSILEASNSLSDLSSENSFDDLTVEYILSEMRECPMPLSPFSVTSNVDYEEKTPEIIVTPSTPTVKDVNTSIFSHVVVNDVDETEETKLLIENSDISLSESIIAGNIELVQNKDSDQKEKETKLSIENSDISLSESVTVANIEPVRLVQNNLNLVQKEIKEETKVSTEKFYVSLSEPTSAVNIEPVRLVHHKDSDQKEVKEETKTSIEKFDVSLSQSITAVNTEPVQIVRNEESDRKVDTNILYASFSEEPAQQNSFKYLSDQNIIKKSADRSSKEFLLKRNATKWKFRMPFKYEHFIKPKRKIINKKVLVNKKLYIQLKKRYAKNYKADLILRALQTLQNSKINIMMTLPSVNNYTDNDVKSYQHFPLPTNALSLKKLAEKLTRFTNDHANTVSIGQQTDTDLIDSTGTRNSSPPSKNNQIDHTEKNSYAQSQEISDSMLEKITDLVSKKLWNMKSLKRKRPRTKSLNDYSDSFNSATEPEIENLFQKKSNIDILQRNKMLLKRAKLQNKEYVSKNKFELDQNSSSAFDSCSSLTLNTSEQTSLCDGNLMNFEMDTESSESFKMSSCPTILSPMSSFSESPSKKTISLQKDLIKLEDQCSLERTRTTARSSLNSSLDSLLLHCIENDSDLLQEFFATVAEDESTKIVSNMDSFLLNTDKNDFELLNKFECNNSPNSIDSGIESKCSPENILQNDSTEENSQDVLEVKSSVNLTRKQVEAGAESFSINVVKENRNDVDETSTLSSQNPVIIDNFYLEQKELNINIQNCTGIQSEIIRKPDTDLKDLKESMPSPIEVHKFSDCPLSPEEFENNLEETVPICIPLERDFDVKEISNKLNDLKEYKTTDATFSRDQESCTDTCDLEKTVLRRSNRKFKVTDAKCSDCTKEDSCTKLNISKNLDISTEKQLETNIIKSKRNEMLQINKNMRREIEARKVPIRTLRSQTKLNSPLQSCDIEIKRKINIKKSKTKEELPDTKRAPIALEHEETQMELSNEMEISVANHASKKRKSKNMTKIKSNVLRQMRRTSRMLKTDYSTTCKETFNKIENSSSSPSNIVNDKFANIQDNFLETKKENPKKSTRDDGKVKILQDIKLNMSINLSESVGKVQPSVTSHNCDNRISSPLSENSNKKIKTKNTSPKKHKMPNISNSSDILSQIINEMDKDRPHSVVKPPPKKNIPVSIEEKQWRLKILDMAEITQNTVDLSISLDYDMAKECKEGTPCIKRKMPIKIKILLDKLFESSCEEKIPDNIILEFKRLDLVAIADVILHRLSEDIYEKPDASLYPAPLMTKTQRLFLRLMLRLEQEKIEDVIDTVLNRIELLLFKVGCNIKSLDPITRMYLAVCRLRGDINKIRTFCCLAFLHMNDTAVPLFFTILTSWIDIMPMAADWQKYPMSKVLVQIVHLKSCNMKGFNLIPLRQLLHQHYGYPKDRWNCDELFEELTHNYLRDPSPASEIAIRLLCKNKDSKWLHQKLNEFFKPLIYKIPSENINFKAQVILLMGKLCRHFKPKFSYDETCLGELGRFFSGLAEEDVHDLIKRSISFSIERLPKNITNKKKKLMKQISSRDNLKKSIKRKKRLKFKHNLEKS